MLPDVSTTLVPQSWQWLQRGNIAHGTIILCISSLVDLLVGSVRGLHFILYVFCELPLPCLILKHFEALSTPAQPTWHSPAAGSTWQVKAVVFAAHFPSSLLYCLLAALKISHHPHSNCPQGSLVTATSGSLLTASVQRTKNIEKRTTCTGAGFACHYQSRRCSKFCCTIVLAPCTKASRSRSRTTHSIHHRTRSMLSLSFSCLQVIHVWWIHRWVGAHWRHLEIFGTKWSPDGS